MKKLVVILCVAIMISLLFVGTMYKDVNTDYLRIHIRANSNYDIDQKIKYQIKDSVVNVLTPFVANCNNYDEVEDMLRQNLTLIDNTANSILKQNGFLYTAKSKLASEEFPTRSYNGFVLEAGIYDALIVELGEAKGDNWWCVIYPPLCFTSESMGSNVVYKSRIVEMIKSFFN